MKYLIFILFSLPFFSLSASEMQEGPLSFQQFYKSSMQVTPGEFTVYRDGSKYFLEIPASSFNQDILVLGDILRGPSAGIAESSGIIHFSKGRSNNLHITRSVYSTSAAPSSVAGSAQAKPLPGNPVLHPVDFVLPVVAYGKTKAQFIIDITDQLIRGGDLLSFKEVGDLGNSDPERSSVQEVRVADGATVFTVLRTHTNRGASLGGGRSGDAAVSYLLQLVIQRLSAVPMKSRIADMRIGFAQAGGDQEQQKITKWNLSVKAGDVKKYESGELVAPANPIRVFIDPVVPALFVPYLEKAVADWNTAFQHAGFKNALVIAKAEKENFMSGGKILIRWANPGSEVATNWVTDPRTGEIVTAKINIGDKVCNEWLAAYFTKCGFKDPRIMTDLYHPQVRAALMQWKVEQGLAAVLGMLPNYCGSGAYHIAQLRSASWLKSHGFSSSVTDEVPFNFVLQPEDQVNTADLMPRVGAYDQFAIGWAYRIFHNEKQAQKVLDTLQAANKECLYLGRNDNDPFIRQGDLSADQLEASVLGMKNIALNYPQLEKITSQMNGRDEDWANFKTLSAAFQKDYQQYGENMAAYIGGISNRPVKKGYNDVPVLYIPKQDQQQALSFLNDWFFSGVPVWVQSKKINTWNNEFDVSRLQYMTQLILKKMISPAVINNLLRTEQVMGKDAYTTDDLFKDLDHYVFKDFDQDRQIDAYTMQMQGNFLFDLSDAAARDIPTDGVQGYNEVIYQYFRRTMTHFGQLAAAHHDADTKAYYQLLKWKIDKELGEKKS